MVAVTLLKNENSNGVTPGTGTFASTSFTPTASSRLYAFMWGQEASGTTDPSVDFAVSGGSLSWSSLDSIGDTASWTNGMRLFAANVGGSPSSMTVTGGTGGARNMANLGLVIVQATGQAGTEGGKAQATVAGTGDTFTLTLDQTPLTDSVIVGCVVVLNNSAPHTVDDGGAGYTELSDVFFADPAATQEVQTRTGSTSTSYSWASVGTTPEKALAIAIEVKNAVTGSALQDAEWHPMEPQTNPLTVSVW